MKKVKTIAIVIFVFAVAFYKPKCDHVFTQVEQAEIKMERPNIYGTMTLPGIINTWPTGKQEGKELICVKCFHQQKQVLEYGQPDHGLRLLEQQKGLSVEDCYIPSSPDSIYYWPQPYILDSAEKPARGFSFTGSSAAYDSFAIDYHYYYAPASSVQELWKLISSDLLRLGSQDYYHRHKSYKKGRTVK